MSHLQIVVASCLIALVSAFPGSGRSGGCIFAQFGRARASPSSSSKSRALLQSQCSLQLSGTSYTFTACRDISATLGSNMILHYSVESGNGGNITFRGGIEAAHVAGESDYIGFGFQPDQEMIGGNAIIIQTCSSCASGASIDDYYLSAEDASGVNSPSQMAVPFKSAALVNDRFIAVFELELNSEQATISNAGAIYSAGPKSSSGAFQTHGYYNGETLDMSPGVTSDLGAALSPLSASSIAPSPALAPIVPPAVQAPAAAPRVALPACGLQYTGNNSVLTFSNCQDLTTPSTANSNLKLFWDLRSAPGGSGTLLVAALEVTNADRWAGFAFPSSPGQMVGSHSIIVRPCTTCPSGAVADKYYLASEQSSDIIAGTGNLQIESIEASQRGGGGLQALFTLRFNQSRNDLNVEKAIIAAVGPSTAGRLNSHPVSNAFTGMVNFASGATVGGTSTSITSRKVSAHGALMIVGWGLLLPFGVVFARCKEWGTIWFQLHRAFQVAGYVAGAAGAGLGWSFGRPHYSNLEQNHRIVGWTVWLLLTIQMLSLFWRPAPKSGGLRTTWKGGHWIAGSASVFLAFANVFVGLKVSGERTLWSILYAIAFGLIVLLWFGKLGADKTFLKNRKLRKSSSQTNLPLKGKQANPSPGSSGDLEIGNPAHANKK